MKPYLSDADFQLFNGDARKVLRELAAERTKQLSLLSEDVSPDKEMAVSE